MSNESGNEAWKHYWPEWAMDDDGETVWVRGDLDGRAAEIAAPALEQLDPETVLVAAGPQIMWIDHNVDTDGGWLLRGKDNGGPYATYQRFETWLREALDGAPALPNGTYARPESGGGEA